MLKDSGSGKFWLLFAVLFTAGLFINFFEQTGEAKLPRKNLGEFPAQLGEWRQSGADERFSTETESVLRADDYVMRNYAMTGANGGRRANLYIGYYLSQKTGATYHSPLNCLPGSGWTMSQPQKIDIKSPGGKTFQANAYIIESDKYKEVLIYWYQGRGRAVADEFHDKIFTIWDSLLRRRSDGSMVRVMTSVGDSQEKAINAALDLAGRSADNISEFVPD
jgi:EpsI family protein